MENVKATIKTLNATSDSIAKDIKSLRAGIQTHLVNLAKFALSEASSGNVAPLTRFVRAIQPLDKDSNQSASVIRADAVIKWLEKAAFVRWSTLADGKAGFKVNTKAKKAFDKACKDKPETLAIHFKVAASQKWNVAHKAESYPVFDFDKRLESLIEAAEKHAGQFADPDKKKAHKVNMARVAAIKAAMAAMPANEMPA